MKILLLEDEMRKTDLSAAFISNFLHSAESNGHSVEIVSLLKTDLAFCVGCMHCWTSETGACFFKDRLSELNEKLEGCSLQVILSPVQFGTFSSTAKALIDKGFGINMFLGAHYPQLVVGYGEDISDEELECFVNISEKHRGEADIVHPELSDITVEVKVTRSLSDNEKIIVQIAGRYFNRRFQGPTKSGTIA